MEWMQLIEEEDILKKLLCTVMIALLLVGLSGCGANKAQNTKTESNNIAFHTGEIKNNNLELADYGANIVMFLTKLGYTQGNATQIKDILLLCGINSIELARDVHYDNINVGLSPVPCYANGDETLHFFFTTEDGVLFYCGFKNEDLYDAEKGGFLKKITDVEIPETKVDAETYSELQTLATDAVKVYLNYPDTSSFNSLDWRVGRENEKYYIGSSVSAKNAFGVKSELSFGVWVVKTDTGYNIEGIQIDGQRVK